MRKSAKKYTKPVGKTRRKPRKKLEASQNQYALPTSYQVTSTQQTISGDPEKAEEQLEMQNMTRRQRLRAQREEERRRIEEAREQGRAELTESAGQAVEYLGETGKRRAARKAAEEAAAATTTAATTAATAPTAIPVGMTIDPLQAATPVTSAAVPGMGAEVVGASATPSLTQGATSAAVTQGTSTAGSAAGQAAASAGRAGIMGTQSAAVTPIALGANLAGTAIKHFGADEDDTTYNAAEISGGLLQKGGEFAGYGAMLGTAVPGIGNVVGGLVGGLVGLGVGGAQMLNRKREAQKELDNRIKKENEQKLREGLAEKELFAQAFGTQGRDLGYNIGQSVGNSYLGGYQMAKAGGKKVPGGEVLPLPGGAVEFRGNKHGESGNGSSSGIVLQESTKAQAGLEVEDKETMDKVKFADGNTDDYIFSSYLKLGGKSFAQRHKDILSKGGSQKQIQELAKLQEEKAKAVKKTPVGPTDQYGPRGKEYIARYGGVKPRRKAQGGLFGPSYLPPSVVRQSYYTGSGDERDKQYVEDLAQRSAARRATKPSARYDAWGSQLIFGAEDIQAPDAGTVTVEGPVVQQEPTTPVTPPVAQPTAEPVTQTTTAPVSTAPAQPSQPGVQYEDALVDVGGVEYSTEDFKRKGRGAGIDYSGDINSTSWGDVLQTNWAENFLTDDAGNVRSDLTQEEIQDIYNTQYIPQVQNFFEENPEAAYNAIVSFADSGNPNASNLRKRIYNADGTLKSKEEILKIGLKNATDGKVGTFHSLFTGGESTEPEAQAVETPQGEEAVIKEEEVVGETDVPDEAKEAVPGIKSPRLRAVPPLAYATLAGNLVGPLAALATKVPKPNLVSPNMQGRERLARVNYNAERAADLNNTTALNRSIENTVSGPAGIVAKMAANNRSRENFLNIANQEAQQNRQIANAEKSMNQAITARNIQNAYDAQVRNAGKMDAYELAKKQKNVQALSDIGMSAGQFATDVMRYQADERIAQAEQIGGEYTRQRYKEAFQSRPKYRKMLKEAGIDPNDDRTVARIAAAAYDPNLTLEEQEQAVRDYLIANPEEEKEDKRYGGRKYTKRSGAVKRKKRK